MKKKIEYKPVSNYLISDSSSNIATNGERPIRGRVSNRRRGRGRARGSSGRARGGRGRGRRPVQDFGQPVRAEVALAERDRQMQVNSYT